jgi:hypothetical protein
MEAQVWNLWKAIATSDTVDLPEGLTGAVWVGGAGNVAAVMQNGVVGTFTGVTAGAVLPIAARRINATGTTATNLVALRSV